MGNLATRALINAVDNDDRIIGVVNRAALPSRPTNFRVVHAFVVNRAGDILLQHIAPNQRHTGRWGSSAAGYVLAGETYLRACRRKLHEELGIEARPSFAGKLRMADLGATKFLSLFTVQHDGPFTLDAEQVDRVRFFKISHLRRELSHNRSQYTDSLRAAFDLYQSRQQ